jgi:hypothetical protein
MRSPTDARTRRLFSREAGPCNPKRNSTPRAADRTVCDKEKQNFYMRASRAVLTSIPSRVRNDAYEISTESVENFWITHA